MDERKKKSNSTAKKTVRPKKRPAAATVATRADRSDEGTASDDGSEGECDYECSECLGSYQQYMEENNGAEWCDVDVANGYMRIALIKL